MMHVDILKTDTLTDTLTHHAFTSIVQWRTQHWIAYRVAQGHGIVPGGIIEMQVRDTALDGHWRPRSTLRSNGDTDYRDPKLIATPDTLYCLCAAYVPKYPRTTLSDDSAENIIQSFLAYTHDGTTWSPLRPVGRPGYWIWSVLPLRNTWVAAAYHTGARHEHSSIHLLAGYSLLRLTTLAIMYDGDSHIQDGETLRYQHNSPSEPVLYAPAPGILACALRTNQFMEIGITRGIGQDWRWHNTGQAFHPSAVLPTPYGLLLAGRRIVERVTHGRTTYLTTTALWSLDAQFPHYLCTLNSDHDTGYASLCPGDAPDTYLMSYYSQHTTPQPYDVPLPGAAVHVAHLRLSAS